MNTNRRMITTLGSIIVAGALVLCHAPIARAQQPIVSPGAANRASGIADITPRPVRTPIVDTAAVRLLDHAIEQIQHATSVDASLSALEMGPHATDTHPTMYDVRYLRPGYESIVSRSQIDTTPFVWRNMITPTTCFVSTSQMHDTVEACDASLTRISDALDPLVSPIRDRSYRFMSVGEWDHTRLTSPLLRSVQLIGTESWNGAPYTVVEWTYEQSYTQPEDTSVYTTRAFINRAGLIQNLQTTNTKGYRIVSEAQHLTINAPLTVADFAWNLAPGTTVRQGSKYKRPTFLGETYPALEKPGHLLDGTTITMDRLLNGKKGALIWWWNTHCTSCIAEMPYFEQLYRELGPRGIVVVAIDAVNGPEETLRARRNVAFNRITMPIVFNADAWKDKLMKTSLSIVDAKRRVVLDTHDMQAVRDTLMRLAQ